MYCVAFNLNKRYYILMKYKKSSSYCSVLLQSSRYSDNDIMYFKKLNDIIKFLLNYNDKLDYYLAIRDDFTWLYLPIIKLSPVCFKVKDGNKEGTYYYIISKGINAKHLITKLNDIKNNKKKYNELKMILDNHTKIINI